MLARFSSWINNVNTTSLRIVVSTICTGIGLLLVLVAIVFFKWEPTDMQLKVLGGMGVVALTVMGLDVTQFIGKRFSDAGYAAAKVTPPVNVEQANVVTAAPGAIPPGVTPPLAREPEHGDDP